MRPLPMLLAVLLPAAAAAGQSTIIVYPGGPLTVQGGIDAAQNGDSVLLLPGTYTELINFKGKNITVKSRSPLFRDQTILNGAGSGPIVTFTGGESRLAVLEGLTIAGGTAADGAGIMILGSSPTIRFCNIRDNTATGGGGGIGAANGTVLTAGTPLVEECLFERNVAQAAYKGGGAIGFNGSNVNRLLQKLTVRRCVFRDNLGGARGGAVQLHYHNDGEFFDCLFLGNVVTAAAASDINGGGALYFGLNSKGLVTNCRFYGNQSGGSTGGAIKAFNTTVEAVNNTFVANTAGALAVWNNAGVYNTPTTINATNCICWQNGAQEFISNPSGAGAGSVPTITAAHCDLSAGTAAGTGVVLGSGNISADPQLLNPASGNHRLPAVSPCVDKGDGTVTGLPSRDFEGDARALMGGVDIGADEFNPAAAFLAADRGSLSLAAGGSIQFKVMGGGSRAGMVFVVLPGLSGTAPGTNLGAFTLPLNLDSATWLLLGGFASSLLGNLDAAGGAATKLVLPAGLPPELAGSTLSAAALILATAPLGLHSGTNDENLVLYP